MKSYTFDMVLKAAITLQSASGAAALAQLQSDYTQAMNCNGGAWADGSPILFEASLNQRPDLAQVDGEDVNVITLNQWAAFNAKEAANAPAIESTPVTGITHETPLSRVAQYLRDGAAADIWFDAASHGDKGAEETIEVTKTAMEIAAVYLSIPTNHVVARAAAALDALKIAEAFMAGFEGDEMQEGIADKLAMIRAAINGTSSLPHKVSIMWGQALEDGQEAKTYEFGTKAELDAFMQGVEEMDGWMAYDIVEEGTVHRFDKSDDDEGEEGDDDLPYARHLFDSVAAAEGWGIFETNANILEQEILQADDEAGIFESDTAAWQHVYDKAEAGSPPHVAAMLFLEHNSPMHHAEIVAHCHD